MNGFTRSRDPRYQGYMEPKPFMVFAYNTGECHGGWGDYDGAYDTLEQAQEHIEKRKHRYEVWEVVDFRYLHIVWKAISERDGPYKTKYVLKETWPLDHFKD